MVDGRIEGEPHHAGAKPHGEHAEDVFGYGGVPSEPVEESVREADGGDGSHDAERTGRGAVREVRPCDGSVG